MLAKAETSQWSRLKNRRQVVTTDRRTHCVPVSEHEPSTFGFGVIDSLIHDASDSSGEQLVPVYRTCPDPFSNLYCDRNMELIVRRSTRSVRKCW